MDSKKINSQSTSSKFADSKFSAEVEGILDVTFGSFGAVTRSKATMLGQQTLQVSSTSTLYLDLQLQKEQSPPQMLQKEEAVLLKGSRRL